MGPLDPFPSTARRRDRFRPAGRNEPRGEVRQGGQHEQPVGCPRVGNLQQPGRLGGIGRASLGRPVDGHSGAPEDEEIEVQLARPPAATFASPERPLEALERHEQGRGAGFRIGPAGNVQPDHRVVECGLIRHSNGGRQVQPRDPGQANPGQRRQRPNGGGESPRRIADVRPERDVGTDPTGQLLPPAR